MRTSLKFRVASNPGHYSAAQRLIAHEGFERSTLTFPTILAYDQDDLIGVIGTRIYDKMIIAGPLVVRTDKRRLWTIMRLCEAYEGAMRSLDIKTFILSVEDGSILDKGIKRYFPDRSPYAMDGQGNSYYAWRLDHGRWGESARPLRGGASTPEEPGRTAGTATLNN